MESYLEVIGARIRFYRTMRRWTQAKLAEKMDSTASYIGQIERGEINFRIHTVERIADALDIDIFALFEKDPLSQASQSKWVLDSTLLLLLQTPDTQKRAYRVLREMLQDPE